MNRITLFTKECCSLCDSAAFVIKKLRRRFDVELEQVDITAPGNAKWFALYSNEIPVIHLDGRKIMQGRISERRLRQLLEQASRAE
jgi:hypothetical protein